MSQIVTIDRQRLLSETLYGRRIVNTVEVERQRLAQETRNSEAVLAQEENRLTEQRETLDPAEFRALADAFDTKVQALRSEGQAREQEFVAVLEREQTAFFERIGPVLGDLVRELGAVVILDRRAILLSTQNIDITELAIERIDGILGDGLTSPATEDAAQPAQPATDGGSSAPADTE